MSSDESSRRVLSGMRPTGALHLGHYHGALKNWVSMQHEYDCYFFVADWHALTTHYDMSLDIEANTVQMVLDWLSVGINPGSCTIFQQSRVPEHAELHLLLSMITPISWLERVPSYKDTQAKLNDRDLTTYGFLGYPLLQSADILIYRAGQVPVGKDQEAHVELTREVARRFNHIYGKEAGFEDHAKAAVKKMGRKSGRMYTDLRTQYVQNGDADALERARALLKDQQNLSIGDRERLFGYLEGGGRIILPEPSAMMTDVPWVPGLDGEKMSKSYGNTIAIRAEPDEVAKKIRTMKTDPARARRKDPGDPDQCPVYAWHQIYSDEKTCQWVQDGCRSAGIGCLDCKAPLIEKVLAEQEPMRKRAEEFENDPDLIQSIIVEGSEKARDVARDTLEEVRSAIGIGHR